MCGIAGMVSGKSISSEVALLWKFIKSLEHRGPDANGQFCDQNVGLAHTRLKILDFGEGANQPMAAQNGVLIFNGEIYNHDQLRSEILCRDFKTHSDTETLLYGLIQYGEEFIPRLNGIFSFVFYNRDTAKIILCRDRYGIKPLYYTLIDDKLYFSSEIKSFAEIPDFEFELDLENAQSYRTFLACRPDGSIYKNIKKVYPGTYLIVDVASPADYQVKTYWSIPAAPKIDPRSEQNIVFETEQLLIEAVKRQVISDAPLGFFLSGGIDSSLIVALAQRYGYIKRPRCYTVDQDTQSSGFENDLPFARLMAHEWGLDLVVLKSDPIGKTAIDHILKIIEEPIPDLSAINVGLVAQRAKSDGVKVLLSGLGADDVFTGYRRHSIARYISFLHHLPIGVFKRLFGKRTRIGKLLYAHSTIENQFIVNLFKHHHDTSLDEQWLAMIEGLPAENDNISKMLLLEQRMYLGGQNLIYTDKVSMRYGIEVRVPFLDHDLVDFSCKISTKMLMRDRQTKHILRKIASKYLPDSIIKRSKTGFSSLIDTSTENALIAQCESFNLGEYTTQYLLNCYATQLWCQDPKWLFNTQT